MKELKPKRGAPDPIKKLQQRELQTFAGCVLSQFLKPITEQRPELWAHRTFLLFQLKIYERLVLEKGEFGPKDYHEMGRTLAEIIKSEPRKSSRARADDDAEHSPEALAEHFRMAMHRVYGTNFQATDDSPPGS